MYRTVRYCPVFVISLFAALIPVDIAGVDVSITLAQAQSQTVTACIARKGGKVRLISKGKCGSKEQQVLLSGPGREGPQGPAGAQGPAGSPAVVRAHSAQYTTPSPILEVSLDPAVEVTGLDNAKTYSVIATVDVFEVNIDQSEQVPGYVIECGLNIVNAGNPNSGVARSRTGIDMRNSDDVKIHSFDSQTTMLYVGSPTNGAFRVVCETGLGLANSFKYKARIVATEVETSG